MAAERHYTPREIADMWNVSLQTVIRSFQDVEGVLKISYPREVARTRKPRTLLRIPASVLDRFHQQRSAGFCSEVQARRRRV